MVHKFSFFLDRIRIQKAMEAEDKARKEEKEAKKALDEAIRLADLAYQRHKAAVATKKAAIATRLAAQGKVRMKFSSLFLAFLFISKHLLYANCGLLSIKK